MKRKTPGTGVTALRPEMQTRCTMFAGAWMRHRQKKAAPDQPGSSQTRSEYTGKADSPHTASTRQPCRYK